MKEFYNKWNACLYYTEQKFIIIQWFIIFSKWIFISGLKIKSGLRLLASEVVVLCVQLNLTLFVQEAQVQLSSLEHQKSFQYLKIS